MFCTKMNEWVGSSLNHWIVMQRNSRQFTQLGIATDWERGGGGSPDFYEFLQFDCSTIRSSSTWLRKSIHWIQTCSFLLHLLYRVFFYCSALKITKCQPLQEISDLFLPKTTKKVKVLELFLPNSSFNIIGPIDSASLSPSLASWSNLRGQWL